MTYLREIFNSIPPFMALLRAIWCEVNEHQLGDENRPIRRALTLPPLATNDVSCPAKPRLPKGE